MVQRAIEAQERIIQITTELKKALMHKLFTEGLHGEPQKMTEIGPVPESWEVVELETTGDVVYGIQAAVANNIAAIGTPILTNKNITLDGGFDLEKLNYFVLTSKRHTATILQNGDILFNWRSGSKYHVGKTAYFDLEGEWVHSSFILRIRPSEKINGRYLFYYFNHLREAEFFVKLQTYAINAKFNASAVNALPTAVPRRKEQDEIAEVLDSAQKKIDNAQQKHRALRDIFRTLLHELMSAKIRVYELEIPT
jgi:type I restriction enzyme, S subunit